MTFTHLCLSQLRLALLSHKSFLMKKKLRADLIAWNGTEIKYKNKKLIC